MHDLSPGLIVGKASRVRVAGTLKAFRGVESLTVLSG